MDKEVNVNVKKKKKKIWINVGITAAIIASCALIFFGAYYVMSGNSYGAYEKSLKTLSADINKANDTTSLLMKGDSIEVEASKTQLNKIIEDLLAAKAKASALIPGDKYRASQDNFVNGINSNVYIYKQLQAVLNNPNAKDADKALEELLKYREETLSYYKKASTSKVTISFSKAADNYVTSSYNYLTAYLQDKKKDDLVINLYSDYKTSFDKILSDFLAIKVDWSSTASRARFSGYDSVLSELNKQKKDLSSLKDKLLALTVPGKPEDFKKNITEPIKLQTSLQAVLEDYDSYLQSFIYNLDIEKLKSVSGTMTASELQELYGPVDEKYQSFNKDYDSFSKLYDEFNSALTSRK